MTLVHLNFSGSNILQIVFCNWHCFILKKHFNCILKYILSCRLHFFHYKDVHAQESQPVHRFSTTSYKGIKYAFHSCTSIFYTRTIFYLNGEALQWISSYRHLNNILSCWQILTALTKASACCR